jgi:hypothetical protein
MEIWAGVPDAGRTAEAGTEMGQGPVSEKSGLYLDAAVIARSFDFTENASISDKGLTIM